MLFRSASYDCYETDKHSWLLERTPSNLVSQVGDSFIVYINDGAEDEYISIALNLNEKFLMG